MWVGHPRGIWGVEDNKEENDSLALKGVVIATLSVEVGSRDRLGGSSLISRGPIV